MDLGALSGQPAAAAAAAAESAGYRPGPLSSLTARVDGLPGRGWWAYVALGIAILAWGQVVQWAGGRMPLGTLDPNLVVLVPYGPFCLFALAFGTRVALRALDTFWPATGWPESARPGWAFQFAFGRPWPEWMALLVGAIAGVASLIGAPPSVLGPESDRGPVYVAYLPAFLAGYSLSAGAALTTIRWLRLVARIQREATAVDAFDRAPLTAFSRVTVLVGLSYLAAAYYSLTVNAAFQVGNAASIAIIGGTMAVAVVTFIVPMWGIHERLAREKEALLRDVERRASRLATELYARVDAGQFDSTAVVNSSLTGVTALRDRIERLPTWPWPPQLFRGFVSALILPLVVFILTRVIADLI